MSEVLSLDSILPKDTSTLSILKPGTDQPTGWTVEFAGPSHAKTVEWANEAARKSLRKSQSIEQQQLNGKKVKVEDRTPEDVKKENVQWVVARIVDWSPVKIGDKTYTFSESNAMELMLKPEMGWAFVQMVDFLTAAESFTTDSANK